MHYRTDTDVQTDKLAEKDDSGGTRTIIARTSYGEMFDFLKAFPSITMDKYIWGMSIAQIALAKYDTTRLVYLPDGVSAKKEIVIDNPMDLINDLNIPIIEG